MKIKLTKTSKIHLHLGLPKWAKTHWTMSAKKQMW